MRLKYRFIAYRIDLTMIRITSYVNKMPIKFSIPEKLVDLARAGSFSNALFGFVPTKVALIGHSLGSAITNALVAANPTVADGVVITGWGYNTGFPMPLGLQSQLYSQGLEISCRQDGRNMITPTPQPWTSFHTLARMKCIPMPRILANKRIRFFKVPFFDIHAAQYFLDRSWPLSLMEVFTVGVLNFFALNVTAPVLLLEDVPDPKVDIDD